MASNPFDLTGRVALVSGGGSGIGRAIAAALLRHGARVLIGSRTAEKIESAAAELSQLVEADTQEPRCVAVALDVQSDPSIERAVRRCVDHFGGLDILVNAAGVMCKKPAFDLTRKDMADIYDTNLVGALRCCQAAGHIFREQHRGSIINIASITSYMDLVGVMAYACTKSAMMALTRGLANEWAKFGIRTNAIAPGFIPTDINRKMIEGTDRGRRIIEHTPMERFGLADEIAGAAVYLASDAASFTNGVTLPIDGGYLASGIGDSVASWATPE